MTNEEREIITRFISRVGGATQPGGFGGATGGPPAPLPPVDKEAADLIGQLFSQYPEAPYRITQMAFVQEAALAEAQNRMRQMQYELEQARQQAAQGQQHRGFLGGLFGGGSAHGGGSAQGGGPAAGAAPQPQQQQYAPPPPPQYAAPQYRPGMFQSGGSGFLGSALTTAAGVAGGLVVGNALMDLFSGNRGGFGGGFGAPGGENVVNNFYGDQAGGADPWGAGGAPPVDPGADAGAGGSDPWAGGGVAPDPGQADPGWGNSGTGGTGGTGGSGGAGTTGGGGGGTTGGGGGA